MRRATILALLVLPAAGQDQGQTRAIKSWIADLGSPDEKTRADAAYALGNVGPPARIAVPALAKALGDESDWVWRSAFDSIKKIGPDGVPALVKALGSGDANVRAAAICLLDECFGRDLKAHVRTIAGLLKDDDGETRRHAAAALAQQGEAAVDPLMGALAAREKQAQEAAILGLAKMGDVAVPPLLKALAAGSDQVRAASARALGALKAEAATDPLIAALSDPSPEVAGAAARALGASGAHPDRVVPLLVQGLRSENATFRAGCIDGLAAYGDAARDGLVAALGADETRTASTLALLKSGERGMATLRGALEADSPVARRAALDIVRRTNPALLPDALVDAANDCLKHADPSVRADAARTVAGLGPRASRDLLAGATATTDTSVRAAAVFALGTIGVDPGSLDDPDPLVRVEALLAAWRIRGGAGAEELRKIAFDAAAEPRVRAAAVTALGQMGLAARAVDLTPLVEGQPVEVRRAAVEALARITQPSAEAIRDSRAARPDKTVDAGLAWLAGKQGAEGEWERKLFTSGTTGLALLAFLAAGCGPGSRHGTTVDRGLRYLIQKQDRDGVLGSRASHEVIVCHGIATMALTEAWILGGDDRCRQAAQRGVDFIAVARNPDLAWRYDPRGGENDTHVTTWMVTALKLADAAGLRVDRDAYAGAGTWIERMTGRSGRIGYNYPGGACARPEGLQDTFPPENVETMTAAGLWCRQLVGGDPLKTPGHRKGIDLLIAVPPRWSSGYQDHIYWNFGALALFQDGDASYAKWQKPLLAAIAASRDGTTGAWKEDDVWSEDGGKVYTTAMGILTLLTPTRYPRDFLTKPKLSAASRAAIAALKRACADDDPQVREIAAAACARLGG